MSDGREVMLAFDKPSLLQQLFPLHGPINHLKIKKISFVIFFIEKVGCGLAFKSSMIPHSIHAVGNHARFKSNPVTQVNILVMLNIF